MIKCYFSEVESSHDALVKKYELLSWDRKQRADACKSVAKKQQEIEAGFLLESKLAEVFGIVMGTASYERGEHGKPVLKNNPEIKFNLSHSGKIIMLTLETEAALEGGCSSLGCDIEAVREIDFGIARRFFTKGEACYIEKYRADFGEQGGREAFFRLWTLKESFMKAVGMGFALPLGDFEICFDGNDVPFVRQSLFEGQFELSEVDCPKGFKAAVCIQK